MNYFSQSSLSAPKKHSVLPIILISQLNIQHSASKKAVHEISAYKWESVLIESFISRRHRHKHLTLAMTGRTIMGSVILLWIVLSLGEYFLLYTSIVGEHTTSFGHVLNKVEADIIVLSTNVNASSRMLESNCACHSLKLCSGTK